VFFYISKKKWGKGEWFVIKIKYKHAPYDSLLLKVFNGQTTRWGRDIYFVEKKISKIVFALFLNFLHQNCFF
jgi:hypothetical protein